MNTSPHPTITGAYVHDGCPTVTVEPLRMTGADFDIVIHEFWQDGSCTMATGRRVKQDGTLYARGQHILVHFPANVQAAVEALKS